MSINNIMQTNNNTNTNIIGSIFFIPSAFKILLFIFYYLCFTIIINYFLFFSLNQ